MHCLGPATSSEPRQIKVGKSKSRASGLDQRCKDLWMVEVDIAGRLMMLWWCYDVFRIGVFRLITNCLDQMLCFMIAVAWLLQVSHGKVFFQPMPSRWWKSRVKGQCAPVNASTHWKVRFGEHQNHQIHLGCLWVLWIMKLVFHVYSCFMRSDHCVCDSWFFWGGFPWDMARPGVWYQAHGRNDAPH